MNRILTCLLCCMISYSAFSLPQSGAATVFAADHLKCYDIEDRHQFQAIVDLDTKQFGLEEGCRVDKAVQFCVPTTKRVVKSTVVPLPIHVKPAAGDSICYRIKCPKIDRLVLGVADQFGKRRIRKDQPRLLCVPAVKYPIPQKCGDGFGDNGVCNGPCPQQQECRIIDANGAKDCRCVDVQPVPCGFDAVGQCGGGCSNPATQKCEVRVGADGVATCSCVPPSCQSTGIRQCGGECPANLTCRMGDADEPCACREAAQTSTCGGTADANGQCGGNCSDPTTPRCATVPGTNICQCQT